VYIVFVLFLIALVPQFLPLRIDRRFVGTPWVTITLIGANVSIYAVTAFNVQQIAAYLGFTPTVHGLYTWFTYMFLHGDVFHIFFNMLFLWLFGSVLEDAIGKVRYTVVYFAGGLAAALTHLIVTAIFVPDEVSIPLIGASGAIAAVIGLVAIRLHGNRLSVGYLWSGLLFVGKKPWGIVRIPALVGVALYFAEQLGRGLIALQGGDGVAYWAHVGGLVLGAVLGLTWGSVRDASRDYLAEEATGLLMSGAVRDAASKFDELAHQDPDNPDWLLHKVHAAVLTPGADLVELAADLDQAVALLYRNERRSEIVGVFRQLAHGRNARLPLGPHTLQIVGSMAESVRDFDVADTAYREVITLHPQSKEAERALFRLAHVFLHRGMPVEARQTYSVFTQRYPSSEWSMYADAALVG